MAESQGLILGPSRDFTRGKYFTYVRTQYTNPRTGTSGYWEHVRMNVPGRIVAVIPITSNGEVVLTKTFRVPLNSWVLEACVGLMDKEGKNEIEIAQAELREELGYEAVAYDFLFAGPFNTGLVNAEMAYYIAYGAHKVCEPQLEDSEAIEPVVVPINKLSHYLLNPPQGLLVDVKLFGVLYFLTRLKI
jgi:8-oxo-dGTP pyrophosphatase MutT (NUDIX family)